MVGFPVVGDGICCIVNIQLKLALSFYSKIKLLCFFFFSIRHIVSFTECQGYLNIPGKKTLYKKTLSMDFSLFLIYEIILRT